MRAKGLVMKGLAVTADHTQTDVISHEGHHLGPIEVATDVLDHLGNARVTGEAVVMAGAKNIQSGGLVVGYIQLPLVAKEVTIL